VRPTANGVPKLVRNDFIAWVLRTGLVGFTARCKLLLQDVPRFGDLVKVRANGTFNLFGLIYDVIVQDDPLVRQLILADVLEPEPVLDQHENRLAPIELSILTVGCLLNGKIIQGLPSAKGGPRLTSKLAGSSSLIIYWRPIFGAPAGPKS
jgi:hypothetical protein